MQRVCKLIKARAADLLDRGSVGAFVGWKKGDLSYDETPAVFRTSGELNTFIYDGFSAASLSKYLISAAAGLEGKILAPLKPCDTYSFNQLVREYKIDRNQLYILGIECQGMIDVDRIRALGARGILGIEESGGEVAVRTLYGNRSCPREDVLLEKCAHCKSKVHAVHDELAVLSEGAPQTHDRFRPVERLEAMPPEERYAFWRGELSRCLRCNACRDVCPACTCRTCIFDNTGSGVASKANSDSFEENLFHIIRAFHVAGRCTDCGECSRVCPQRIPLHLLNRKHIRDINTLYGEYQAGADTDAGAPLTTWSESDAEPDFAASKGGGF
jgi:ferredoxin